MAKPSKRELSKRSTRNPKFKAWIATETISGRKSMQEIAAGHGVNPIQMSPWRSNVHDSAIVLFTRGKRNKDKDERQGMEAELFQQIGKLQMEREWLTNISSCSGARELRKLVDYVHLELSARRQCALLGLLTITLYYPPTPIRQSTLQIMTRIGVLYLEETCNCIPRMVHYLDREGIPFSCDWV